MRLPRPRFTVRRLMVAVAIIAVATYTGMVGLEDLRPMPCGLTLMPAPQLGALLQIRLDRFDSMARANAAQV